MIPTTTAIMRRTLLRSPVLRGSPRNFSSTGIAQQEAVAAGVAPTVVKVKRPMGAFRGGFLGFLFGSTLAFGASFTYLRDEWKTRDEILMEEFASLRSMCMRVESRFREVEDKIAEMDKKKRR